MKMIFFHFCSFKFSRFRFFFRQNLFYEGFLHSWNIEYSIYPEGSKCVGELKFRGKGNGGYLVFIDCQKLSVQNLVF